MSAQRPFSSAFPFSAGFLKAWVDQAGAFQDMLSGWPISRAAVPASMPPPLLAPWKDFVDRMGMGAVDPAQVFSGCRFGNIAGVSRDRRAAARSRQGISTALCRVRAAKRHDHAGCFSGHEEAHRCGAAGPQNTGRSLRYMDRQRGKHIPQAAHSDDFARLLAELCNISSAFKVERGKLTEQIARHLDLPSRAEVDTLHRQVRCAQTTPCACRGSHTGPAARQSAAKPQAGKKMSTTPHSSRKC